MGILAKIQTREDLDNLIEQIDALSVSLYKSKVAAALPEVIKAEFEDSVDKQGFLEKLREQLVGAVFLGMAVPVELSSDGIAKISLWAKKNIGRDVILDLAVDPDVLAGVKFSFNGKFKSYSLKEEFEKAISILVS